MRNNRARQRRLCWLALADLSGLQVVRPDDPRDGAGRGLEAVSAGARRKCRYCYWFSTARMFGWMSLR